MNETPTTSNSPPPQTQCVACGKFVSITTDVLDGSIRMNFNTGRSSVLVCCSKACRQVVGVALRDPETLTIAQAWDIYIRPRVESAIFVFDEPGMESQAFIKGTIAGISGCAKVATIVAAKWAARNDRGFTRDIHRKDGDDGDADDGAGSAAEE